MIEPKHRVCDICGQPVGVNMRYFIIKSKNFLQGFAGSCTDNRRYDICEECMWEITKYIRSKDTREGEADDE